MKTIENYIESCLRRSNSQINYLLHCQSCSGTAKEKLGFKILEAEFNSVPTAVIWFGNGFDAKFIEQCLQFPARGQYIGLFSVEEFCTKALAGEFSEK